MTRHALLTSPRDVEHPPLERWLMGGALAALCVVAAVLRGAGLDPASLWLDDQWVGIVVRRMDWGQYLELRPPVPIGFVAVESLVAAVFSDPEWPLQLVPFLSTLAVVPLLGVLVARWTGWRTLGLLTATLWVVSPTVSTYAVAVKSFPSDALITLLLLLAGTPLLCKWEARRARWLVLGALAAVPFSFTSVLVAFPLLHVAFLGAMGQQRWRGAALLRPALVMLAYDVGLVVLYFLLVRGYASPALTSYWSDHFQLARGVKVLVGALSERVTPLVAVIPAIGIGVLLVRPSTRMLGVFAVAFYCGLLAVAALELYPLGGGRTDLFGYPLTLTLYTVPLAELRRWPRLRPSAAIVFVVCALVILAGSAKRSRYGEPDTYRRRPCEDARLVAHLADDLRDDDALIVYPHGAFALGYYGAWPLDIRPSTDYAHGFEVQLRRPHTLVLPGYADLRTHPRRLAPHVRAFLDEQAPARLGYFSSFAIPEIDQWIDAGIQGRGYTPVVVRNASYASLRVYERSLRSWKR